MRLIDADKVIVTRYDYEKALTLKERLHRLLNNQPTVKAIPIEWLINKCNEADNMGMGIDDWSVKDCYQLVLEQWEKENEID